MNEFCHTSCHSSCRRARTSSSLFRYVRLHLRSLREACRTFDWVKHESMIRIWMRHAAHVWSMRAFCYSRDFMSHVDESCHTWMKHVSSYEPVTSQINGKQTFVWYTRWHRSEPWRCFMSDTWMRHVSRMKESCLAYEYVHAHVMSLIMQACAHVVVVVQVCAPAPSLPTALLREACRAFDWILSRIWMRHATHLRSMRAFRYLRESCLTWVSRVTHECDMSHHTNQSYHTQPACLMSHT